MKRITIDIDDQFIPSVESFLRTQMTSKTDELTGKPMVEMIYANMDEFFQRHITELLRGLVQQYPSQAIREKLAQMKVIQDEIASMVTPTVALADVSEVKS